MNLEVFMIKLVASDLDGTLLLGGAQELTPRAIELIHQLTQKGIHFVSASGRQMCIRDRFWMNTVRPPD